MSDTGYQQDSPAGERQLTPQESLELISEQRESAVRSLYPRSAPMLASWGAAWLLGFGAFWLASANPPLLPGWSAAALLVALSVLAVAVTAGQLMRGRGVTGPSRDTSRRYGWAWALGWAGLYAFNLGLMHDGLPPRLAPLVWPGSSLLLVGVLYLAGGAIWQDRVYYGLGTWTLVVAAAAVFAGTPGNFAVMALGGGGGLLAAAAAAQLQARRARAAR